ncbi:MAG TPA: hypothetical protein VFD49_07870 [Candidatus Dormibacteraeota bacterium]|nr:hypothetical protein [Candidatus Dormibacteraeota bacterium]
MPSWATAVIVVEAAAEPVPRSIVSPGRGRPLAHSPLGDAGDGRGQLWFLDRGACEEARAATPAGEEARTLRTWDALVDEGAAATADGWYLSLPADLGTGALEFDDPAVAGAIQRTLGSYLPLLGHRVVATSTLMPDWRRCAGALTVFEARSEAEARTLAANDPWRAIFTGRLFRLERAIVRRVPPPAGPGTQRYGGANPWPGGAFGAHGG